MKARRAPTPIVALAESDLAPPPAAPLPADVRPRVIAEQTEGAGRDVARYVGSLAGEMALMARREGMTTLAHLLDMARMEAREIERRLRLEA